MSVWLTLMTSSSSGTKFIVVDPNSVGNGQADATSLGTESGTTTEPRTERIGGCWGTCGEHPSSVGNLALKMPAIVATIHHAATLPIYTLAPANRTSLKRWNGRAFGNLRKRIVRKATRTQAPTWLLNARGRVDAWNAVERLTENGGLLVGTGIYGSRGFSGSRQTDARYVSLAVVRDKLRPALRAA